jgi:hypothetical protein
MGRPRVFHSLCSRFPTTSAFPPGGGGVSWRPSSPVKTHMWKLTCSRRCRCWWTEMLHHQGFEFLLVQFADALPREPS